MNDLTATGGHCAPVAPTYQFGHAGPDEKRLKEAVHAARSWINEGGSHFQVSIDPDVLTAANTDEEARLLIAETIARRAIDAYTRPPTLAELLPPISAPRGGIHYPTPPTGAWGPPPTAPTGMRLKIAELTGAIRRERQRAKATRKRLADARAVWQGRKDAYTEAEIDSMLEDY